MSGRGVSPAVGFIVLVGLTAVVAISILTVSSAVLTDAQSSAKQQQVEHSMSQFAYAAEGVSSGQDREQRVTLSGDSGGSTEVDPDAGYIDVVLVDESGNETTLMSGDLGLFRQTLADGTEIVYQGGGVYRSEGGQIAITSPPALRYRHRPEPTLSFPQVRVQGNVTGSSQSLTGQLEVARQRQQFPGNDTTRVVGSHVYIEIESAYCTAWQKHAASRTDGFVEETCSESNRTSAPNELLINASVPGADYYDVSDAPSNFGFYSEAGMNFAGSTGGQINGSIAAGGNISWPGENNFDLDGTMTNSTDWNRDTHDDEIESLVDNAPPGSWGRLCAHEPVWASGCDYGEPPGSQTVYIDDFDGGGSDIDVDLSDGNVTMVVDDELEFQSSTVWNVTGHESGHVLKIYTTGDIDIQSGYLSMTATPGVFDSFTPVDDAPSETNAQAIQIYAGSAADIQARGYTMEIEGVISAPTGDTGNTSSLTHSSGTLNLVGAIHSTTMDFSSNTVNLYHSVPAEWEERATGDDANATDTEVYYLHLSEVVLEFDERR